jgi:hypothetical protein
MVRINVTLLRLNGYKLCAFYIKTSQELLAS